jgi:hypothetical protein
MKVIDPPSLLQDTCSFADFFPFVCIALTVRLEAAEKALVEERIAELAADQPLAKERVARMVVD